MRVTEPGREREKKREGEFHCFFLSHLLLYLVAAMISECHRVDIKQAKDKTDTSHSS